MKSTSVQPDAAPRGPWWGALWNGQDATSEPSAQAWKILGGLRFGLAAIVVCDHLHRFVRGDILMNGLVLRAGGALNSFTAVLCFLVISGYSIGHSISTKPKGYLFRRFRRVYPLYIAAVAAVPLAHALASRAGAPLAYLPGPGAIACNLFLLQGFACDPLAANGPLWTLALEVFCYLAAPFLVLLRTRTLTVIVAASALSYAIFPQLHLQFFSHLLFGLPVLFLGWAWMSGFVLYRHRHDLRFHLCLLALFSLMFSANHLFNSAHGSYVTILGTVFVLLISEKTKLPGPVLAALDYLGELSYPIYLVHAPLFAVAAVCLGVGSAPVMIGLAMVMAAALYHFVDKPLRRPKRAVARQASHTATTWGQAALAFGDGGASSTRRSATSRRR